MRILLITETVPCPLDSGGRIKTWHTLRALAAEHEVHCHAFARSEAQREEARAALSPACASVTVHLQERTPAVEALNLARSLAQGLPFTVARHYSGRVMSQVAADCRARGIELVYCDHLSMLEYGRRLRLPLVHDAHNIEYRVAARYAGTLRPADPRRPLVRREARLLERYERRAYPACSLIFAVSDVDAAEIAAVAPDVPVIAVPIAVGAAGQAPVARITDAPEVLFVGALDWPPNADAVSHFLEGTWPAVLQLVPTARLTVVGRGGGNVGARRAGSPGVRFTGRVDDVGPWFERSRVMVAPLRSGSGMRVKILDAFARGVPVVSTSVGIEGIAARPGEHALVADDDRAFAEATARVLQDRSLAQRLATAARALVLERYDTAVVGQLQLDALRRTLVAHARETRRGCAAAPAHA